jgi:hypothetical protein
VGSRRIATHILNLGAGRRWVVTFTPRSLFPRGKNPRYPLYTMLSGLQSRSGRGGAKKKKILSVSYVRQGEVLPVPLTEHHAMKAYWGSGDIAPRILHLSTRWKRVISFTTLLICPPPQGNNPWYPLDRGLGRPQNRSGHSGKEKNFQPLPGLESLIIQSVAQRYTIGLSRLLTM